MTETLYFDASAPVRCFLRLPPDYESRDDWPVLVGLHGGGNDAEEFLSVRDMFDIPEFVFAAPRAPYPFSDDGQLAYDWSLWPSGDLDTMERGAAASEEWIAACIRALKAQYPKSPVYLLGFSQGALMTYRAGIRHCELLDGLIVLSGPGLYEPLISPWIGEFEPKWPSEAELSAANELRVFIAHGREDHAIKYTLAERSHQVLAAAGFDVTFHAFNGGHSLADAQADSIFEKVSEWLAKHEGRIRAG